LHTKADLQKFVKNNRQKIEKGTGFTRYLLVATPLTKGGSEAEGEAGGSIQKMHTESPLPPFQKGGLEPIEYFYLEEPSVPEKHFPLNVYGIYDRITMEEMRIPRLKEDIIKILGESKKFGVRVSED
jgi:hypothetical protein